MAKTKVDLFKADKKMAERVTEFMQKKVWGITLSTRIKREIAETEASIDGLEKLKGSIFEEKIPEMTEELNAKLEAKVEALKKQKQDEATFDFTDVDKTFYKDYKNATSDAEIKVAIEKWFNNYSLDVKNSTLEDNVLSAISGKKRNTARGIVRSNATKFNADKRTKNDVLILFYGELAEAMLEVGTLKAEAIPEDVREFYAPKKNTKKSK